MNTKVLIGADPELFIGKQGKVASAIGLVGGTKTEPRKVPLGALQEDNVLLEFNIDPASNLDEFRRNIRAVMEEGRSTIRQFQMDVVSSLSSHSFSRPELESFGEQAFIFGCDPDFNAWFGCENVKPHADDPGLRTAGGHIHIGYSHLQQPDMDLNENIVKMCDYLLGIPSILIDPDERRRELYGKAGAYRHKQYGVEYRTLSNFWVFSDELMQWAYDNAVLAYENQDKLQDYMAAIPGAEVQRIINANDKRAAKAALETLGINCPAFGEKIYA